MDNQQDNNNQDQKQELKIYPYNNKYICDTNGKVYKTKDMGELNYYKHPKGYLHCYVGKTKAVHKVIAETFIPNPENKPQVNHIDGNKQNNHVDNLEWVTNKENANHAINNGLWTKFVSSMLTTETSQGELNSQAVLQPEDVLDIRELIKQGMRPYKIAKVFGVSPATIYDIKSRRSWKHI